MILLNFLLCLLLLAACCPIGEPSEEAAPIHTPKIYQKQRIPADETPETLDLLPVSSETPSSDLETEAASSLSPETPPKVADLSEVSSPAALPDASKTGALVEVSEPAAESPNSALPDSEFFKKKVLAALLKKEELGKSPKYDRRATEDGSETADEIFKMDQERCGNVGFWCGEGTSKCIPMLWVCDNMYDCISGLDEQNCTITFSCPPNTLVCHNGNCVDAKFRCNGIDECGDLTDEEGCPKDTTLDGKVLPTWCADNMHRCERGPCISLEALCDGFTDCPHGEDEAGCTGPRATCENSKFKCETGGTCIPIPWVCDKNPDCPDKSDEKYCDENGDPIPERDQYVQQMTPVCSKDQWACRLDPVCVDRSLLCNGRYDCPDRSDEGGMCNSCQTKGCEWKCIANPLYPTCECPRGKVLNERDQRTCVDIDECAQGTSGCDHYCENVDGGFECYCSKGYKLEHDGKNCTLEADSTGHLFVSVNKEVRKLPLFPDKEIGDVFDTVAGSSHKTSQQVFGLDFDNVKGNLYLSMAQSGGQQGEIHFLSQDDHKCLVSGFDGLSNVAADWITGNIYFTVSGASFTPGVGVCSEDGRFCRMLVTGERIHRVRALALHPRRRMLYWSDWDAQMPRIEEAEMDGSNGRVLVDTKISWPNGLSIDYVRDHLYWTDGELKMIERLDLNTQERQVVMSQGLQHANELLVFDDTIFWGDWELGAVLATDIQNVSNRRTVQQLPNIPLGLAIAHPTYQDAAITNYCMETNCTHLCVLSASREERYTCLCPTGYEEGRRQGSCVKKEELVWDEVRRRNVAPKKPGMCPEEFLRLCQESPSPCLNGGSCLMKQTPTCECRTGFFGDYCEYSELDLLTEQEAINLRSRAAHSLGWLTTLVVVAVTLLILGVLVAVYIRKTGLGGKYNPSQSTPLRNQSTVSFARFRRQQLSLDREKERMVKGNDGVSISGSEESGSLGALAEVNLDKMESFGNPLYEEEFGNAPNVHKTVLALNASGLSAKGAGMYYSIVDNDSGIDQASTDGSGSPIIV